MRLTQRAATSGLTRGAYARITQAQSTVAAPKERRERVPAT